MKHIRDEMKKGKKVYLQFLLIEKPDAKEIFSKDQKIGYDDQQDSANYGNMEFVRRGWCLFELSDFNDHIRVDEQFQRKVMQAQPILSPAEWDRDKEFAKENYEMPETYIIFSTRYCDLGKAKRAVSKSNTTVNR